MTLGESAATALREVVGDRASAMLLDRLCRSLERCADDAGALTGAVDKIRTSLRLFVDERVAERADTRLRVVLRLGPRDADA